MKELLNKFFMTPGLCSIIELSEVKKFLLTYKSFHDIYKSATNREPLGFTLDVELENVEAYINRRK